MHLKFTGKCFVKQGLGLVLFCKMMPFIITEYGDIDKFKGGKMHAIYQAHDHYINIFEEQVRELQAEKSQGIITNVYSSSYR